MGSTNCMECMELLINLLLVSRHFSHAAVEGLPEWLVSRPEPVSPGRRVSGVLKQEELKHGMYGVVRSLLRVLDNGATAKALLDTVIDSCR